MLLQQSVRVASIIFLLIVRAYGSDWPVYLGDLSHTSFRPDETQINTGNLTQLQQLWRTSVGATISSAVTSSDGFLFFGAWDGNFYSMDAATGAVAWSTFVGVAPSPEDNTCMPGIGVAGQAVVAGDTVYVGGGDAAVYALDRNSGVVRWRLPLGDPNAGYFLWSSMVISGNVLYAGIASLGDCPLVRGGLARISLENPSNPRIRYFVPEGNAGASLWSTPAIDESAGLVYVATGNAAVQDAVQGQWGSALLAMDAATLEIKSYFFRPIALFDDDADWGSSPMLFQAPDGRQLVAANGKDGVMYVLSRPDLSLVWEYKIATDCDSPLVGCGSISTPAFDGQTIYTGAGTSDAVNSPPGAVYAFDPAAQAPRWVYAARGVVLAPVTITPGLVFAATTKGLSILDAGTGAELWNDQSTIGIYSQPVVSNGTIFATYVNGDVAAWGIPGDGSGGDRIRRVRRVSQTPGR